MAISKIKVKKNFTQIGNNIFNDPSISLRDKGVYCTLCSFSDDWNFSIEGMATRCTDGETSIRSSLKTLEAHGYINRKLVRNSKGHFEASIEIFAMPKSKDELTSPYNADYKNGSSGHSKSRLSEKRLDKDPRGNDSHDDDHPSANPHGDDRPGTDPQGNDHPGTDPHSDDRPGADPYGDDRPGIPVAEKTAINNTNKPINKIKTHNSIIIPIHQSIDGSIEEIETKVAENINLKGLLAYAKQHSGDEVCLVKTLYEIICEMLCTKRDFVIINGINYPWELFRKRYLQLRFEHIVSILERSVSEGFGTKEGNPNYLRVVLYNEPVTRNIKAAKKEEKAASSNYKNPCLDYEQRVYTDDDYIAFEKKKLGII